MSRRQVMRVAAGVGAGIGGFAVTRRATAAPGTATPAAGPALGYVSLRLRQLGDAAARAQVNDLVTTDFIPDVQDLPGYQGYILADVLDDDRQSLAVVVLDDAAQAERFTTLAQQFVAGLPSDIAVETPVSVAGDLMITGANQSAQATPAATASPNSDSPSYVAVRVHTSLPGTDPLDFVPLATNDFVPIIANLPGFQGYLWFPSEGGFTAVSLYDSEATARESTEAAADFVAEYLTAFTDGNPRVINATGVFVDLPILDSQGSRTTGQ